MIRNLIVSIENWCMNDDSALIATAKLLFVVTVAMAAVVVPIALIGDHVPASRVITLDSAKWSCTASHETTYMTAPILAGKVMIPGHLVTQTICDQWSSR